MIRIARQKSATRRRRWLAAALALTMVPHAGCAREFFRNWANQDATEAIFEKSRDPRFRLELFSVEPPALSRFASPYDPDFPPAPPDDLVTEALSPVPQWPKLRLLTPLEGTGYLDMLEAYRNDRPAAEVDERHRSEAEIERQKREAAEAENATITPPAAPNRPSPFRPEAPAAPDASPGPSGTSNSRPNSGTDVGSATPPSTNPSIGRPPAESASRKDPAVLMSAFQETNIPPPAVRPIPPDVSQEETAPPVPLDERQIDIRNVDTTPGLGTQSEEEDQLKKILTAPVPWGNEQQLAAAGLAKDQNPYRIGPRESLELALINSRIYQFRLEGLLLTALPVTLQRFAFEPQGYAGLGPTVTGVGGAGLGVVTGAIGPTIPPGGGVNQFLYRTNEAPGGQLSQLNLSTIAGFGKLFASGLRLAGGFANTTVFQFNGPNSRQPIVQSILPITLTQPFLRGGGRAVTLEPLTQAERNMLYEIRNFARFRQEFFVNIMTTTGQGFATASLGGGVSPADPTVGYLNLIQNLQQVENDLRNVVIFERVLKIYKGLAQGAGSSVSSLDVDQIDLNLQSQKSALLSDQIQYRVFLDQFKIQLGLPPDVEIVADYGILGDFSKVYKSIFALSPVAREDLDRLMAQLPDLEDVILDGRSVQAAMDNPDLENDLLLAAERLALENRLDLMNQRAQLYDTWRQIRIAHNALQGIFNVTITNQVFTPPTTSNPFAFLDQAKQFSLVLNGELPLVRVNERNNFRLALINYERARRVLMANEDNVKFQVRNDIRQLLLFYKQYDLQKRNFISTVRATDLSLQNIIGPQQAAAGGGGGAAGGTQTQLYAQNQGRIVQVQNGILGVWVNYQIQRLVLYRDLGTMPYDEWEAYYELFPAATGQSGAAANAGGNPGPAAAPAASPAGGP
jgi:hypothetical protein